MFKKVIAITLFLILTNLEITSYSITIEEAQKAFSEYVLYSNNYSAKLKEMYTKNTIIKRVVTKEDGTTYEKILPVEMYKTMLTYYSKIALWQGYKNEYTNMKYKKIGDNVEVSCVRHPSTSKDKLPAKIIFGKNDFGRIIIKQESFHTNAAFLVR